MVHRGTVIAGFGDTIPIDPTQFATHKGIPIGAQIKKPLHTAVQPPIQEVRNASDLSINIKNIIIILYIY